MAWTKAKTAIVAGVGILLVCATTTVTVKEIHDHRRYPWEVPHADFSTFYRMPAAVKIVPTKFAEDGGLCCDSSRGAMGIAQSLKEIIRTACLRDRLHTVVTTELPTNKYDFLAKLVGPRELHKTTPQNTNWAVALPDSRNSMISLSLGVSPTANIRISREFEAGAFRPTRS
jgi:hypothetical protein